MGKGFILTIDALTASLTVIVAGFLVFILISASLTSFVGKQNINSVGNDLLAVLDQTEVFHSYIQKSENQVVPDLENRLELLPENYCGDIHVKIYKYQSGFVLEDDFQADTNCNPGDDVTKVKRMFFDIDRERYGLSELELWLK